MRFSIKSDCCVNDKKTFYVYVDDEEFNMIKSLTEKVSETKNSKILFYNSKNQTMGFTIRNQKIYFSPLKKMD